MSERQKRAAATISFGIVLVCVLALVVLATATGATGKPLGDRFPGRQLILLVHTRNLFETMLQGIPALITIGISIVTRGRLKDWQYYATVAVTVIGIAMCVYLVMELSDPDQAQRFWAFSPVSEIENYASFNDVARPFFVTAGVWFVAILGIQLGLTGQRQAADADEPAKPDQPNEEDPQ